MHPGAAPAILAKESDGAGAAALITFALQSGSNGNCIYVEAGDVRLLFDAGISGRQAMLRMAEHGRDIRDVDALIISHDHNDHIRCAGIYQRKFGLPIYVTRRTLEATWSPLGRLGDVRWFRAGDVLRFGDVNVYTIPTPHDAADPVIFVVEHDGRRLGIFTDLGHPFAGLSGLLRSVDAAYVESNYDPHMLDVGPYSPALKARIRGPGGHLSNVESAELLRRSLPARWVMLAHLSEQNNQPDLALDTHRRHVARSYPFGVASRYHVSPVMQL